MSNIVNAKVVSHIKKVELINQTFSNLEIKVANKARPLSNPFFEKLFKTEKGQKIRAMNLAALNGIGKGMTETPKAACKEDAKLIASNAANMVNKWISWIDPNSGQIYTIIKKGDNPDGTKLVRILNKAGEVVTETNIAPKKIVVLDDFQNSLPCSIGEVAGTHGAIITKFIERNNPIADIEAINCTNKTETIEALKEILKRIQDGETIDALNCSFGDETNLTKAYRGLLRSKVPHSKEIIASYSASKKIIDSLQEYSGTNSSIEKINEQRKLIEEIISSGTEVVFAAGNKKKEKLSLFSGIEGCTIVGALSGDAKIADYSASRAFTPHFEIGAVTLKATADGVNITGQKGADISYNDTPYANWAGKNYKELITTKQEIQEYLELLNQYSTGEISDLQFCQNCKKFDGKIIDKEQKNIIEYFKNRLREDLSKQDNGINVCINLYDKCKELVQDTKTSSISPNTAYFLGDTPAQITKDGFVIPVLQFKKPLSGTSIAAPQRTARITLNKAMEEILK